MRKSIFFIFLLSLSTGINAQQSYTINDYGTYIIDFNQGSISRVPIEQDLFFTRVWKNYVLFDCLGRIGTVIYNRDSGAVSDIFFEPQSISAIKILEDNYYFIIFVDSHIFKLHPETLEIVEKTYVGKLYTYLDVDQIEYEPVIRENTGEFSKRCYGRYNYIDIFLDNQDMNVNNFAITHNSTLNLYVVIITETSYTR